MSTRKSKSPRRSKSPRAEHKINKYFDKIFVISLYDQLAKFEKVKRQFSRRKIQCQRFVAIDGRCKKEGKKGCDSKLSSFQIAYDVDISNKTRLPLKELIPASSLTIGTILLLREMVRKGWKRILICEDDVELCSGFESALEKGIEEIGDHQWDVLYLGSGSESGNNGISCVRSPKLKHISYIGKIYKYEYYVSNKNDLRIPSEGIVEFSDHLSIPLSPGGTWAYAYSLAGAKKMLKLVDDDAGNHMDKLLSKYVETRKLRALAFDPPIIYHEHMPDRTLSSIPWEW